MRKFCCQAVTVALLILSKAGIAYGQDEDLSSTSRSGVLDWIKKLSGPSMASVGFQLGLDQGNSPIRLDTNRKIQFRIAALIGTAVAKGDSAVIPEDSEIYMATLQPTVIVPLVRPFGGPLLELGVGASAHGFLSIEPDSAGGDSGTLIHVSFPVFLQTPIALGPQLVLAVGIGARGFPPFPNRAFEPVDVRVKRSGWEWSLATFFSLEHRRLKRN